LAATLADAKVDLKPHQIDAALFAFRSPLSKGAILADEVGLGKTIEAGILLSQKWAEKKRRLLIIVPAGLRKQWNQELADKFFLPSTILEAGSFKRIIKQGNLNPFNQSAIVICSYHFAFSQGSCIKQVNWDLVIVDEAHRLRNVYMPTNRMANTIKSAISDFHKVLLTATPLQNSVLELYGLVSVIDDFVFGDLKSFKVQYTNLSSDKDFADLQARLKTVCQRTLRRQVLKWIPFTNRKAIRQEFYPTLEEQRLYDLVSEYLQRPTLFALPLAQRRLMTLILRKLLGSSTYAISGTLEALSNRLEKIVKEQGAMALKLEDVASDYDAIDETADEWSDEEGNEERPDKQYTAVDLAEIAEEAQSLRYFRDLAKSIVKNSKGEVLLTALKKGLVLASEKGAQKKAIIFTEFRRTQDYLQRILEETEYAGKTVLYNGSNTDPKSSEIYARWMEKHKGTDLVSGSPGADRRAAVVDYFRDEAIIMIATEAAAEGINLQFCSLVVNYDLPWNPQRIEQRIGRCHRYGQKCDVVVVNFVNKANAADVRVYELLAEKFKLFDGVFGASDEVLGSIASGVDFEKRILDIYQICRTPEQFELDFNTLQKESEHEIGDEIRMTRQKVIENFDVEVQEKLRLKDLESNDYLSCFDKKLWEITRFYLQPHAAFQDGQNAFCLKTNPFPEENIHLGTYNVDRNVEGANLYRIGHPLAQRIIDCCKNLPVPVMELSFSYSGSGRNIAVLDPLVGKAGWMQLTQVAVTAIETEDHLFFSALTDDGQELDESQCQRLFSLSVQEVLPLTGIDTASARSRLNESSQRKRQTILERLSAKDRSYYNQERDKLDHWRQDQRSSLKLALKELEEEIAEKEKQARLAPSLPEQLKLDAEKRKLQTRSDEAWERYVAAAREIERRVDTLIEAVKKKLNQQIAEECLFLIRWRVT